jgi:hypothetical protein
VKLKEARGWQPIKYVTYLWLLIDKDDLRVGIETQVAAPKLPGNQEPTSSHQKEAYGHPTLSGAATCDAQGNPLRTWKRQEDGTWKAEKRRTPAYQEDQLKAVAGGELIYYRTDPVSPDREGLWVKRAGPEPDRKWFSFLQRTQPKPIGRWIITTNSGRYGRSEKTSAAVMPKVQSLFKDYVGLSVTIDYHFTDNQPKDDQKELAKPKPLPRR